MTDAQLKTEPDSVIAYDDQKRMARDGSHDERRDLAARADVRPEILYYLAGDPDPANCPEWPDSASCRPDVGPG